MLLFRNCGILSVTINMIKNESPSSSSKPSSQILKLDHPAKIISNLDGWTENYLINPLPFASIISFPTVLFDIFIPSEVILSAIS